MHSRSPDPEDTAYPDWLRDALESEGPGQESPAEPRSHEGGVDEDGADAAGAEESRSEPSGGMELPGEAGSREPATAPERDGRLLYRGLQISLSDSQRLRCRVALRGRNGDYFGTAEGRNVPALRARIAAQATLDALARAHGEPVGLALVEADVVRALGAKVVVVGIHASEGRQAASLVGACPVQDSVEQAAVLATLQATNRWLGRGTTGDGDRSWPGPLTWPS